MTPPLRLSDSVERALAAHEAIVGMSIPGERGIEKEAVTRQALREAVAGEVEQAASDDLEMANGCLVMIHDDLVSAGLSMKGCPPMMYNDAIRQLVNILGRKAGLTTWAEVAATVRAHEAEAHAGTAE